MGTLTSLNVTGTVIAGAFSGPLTGNVTGNITGSAGTAGTVTTAAQPNITSLGILSSLTVNGAFTANTYADVRGSTSGAANAMVFLTADSGFMSAVSYRGTAAGNLWVVGKGATTGVGNDFEFYSNTNGKTWYILQSGGHLLAGTDNAFNIGASGANRPANLYVANNGVFGGTVTAANFVGPTTIDANNLTGTTLAANVVNSSLTKLGNTVGIGSGSSPNVGVYVTSTTLTTANQYGVFSSPTFTNDATSGGTAIFVRAQTADAAFTVASVYGLYVDNTLKGAGSTITTAYGIYVNTQSGGATNYAIYTVGTAPSVFGGVVTVTEIIELATTGIRFGGVDVGVYTGSGLVYLGDRSTGSKSIQVNYTTGAVAIPTGPLTVTGGIGGTLTTAAQPNITSLGTLTGTQVFSAVQTIQWNGQTTSHQFMAASNTGASLRFGIESSTGGNLFTGSSAYATVLGTTVATSLQFGTNLTTRFTIDSAGAATFTSTVTATGFTGNLTGTVLTAAQGNITSLGTLTGLTLSGVTAQSWTGQTTSYQFADAVNSGGHLRWGIEGSAGAQLFAGASAYSAVLGNNAARSLHLGTNGTVRFSIDSAGAALFTGTVGGITTLSATTLNGILGTAAQTNITSLGQLTGLTIAGLFQPEADNTRNIGVAATGRFANMYAVTFNGALSGNAATATTATTATTLQTARNINGTSFNGSANIEITTRSVRASKSANQTLTSATAAAVSWDVETWDTDAFHDNVTNNSRFTAPVAGKYLVICDLTMTGSGAGNCTYDLRKNGTTGPLQLNTNYTGASWDAHFHDVISLAASDYIEIWATQNTGGNNDIIGGVTRSHIEVIYLGA